MMKAVMKWLLIILAGAAALILLAGGILYGFGKYRFARSYTTYPLPITYSNDPSFLKEGKRIFQYRGCEACHGENLEGLVYLDNPAIGQVITPNLTEGKGGIGGERSDLDLIRAIRNGVKPDGTPLLFMPSTEFYYLSDKDLGAVLAHLRNQPPVENYPAASQLSPTGFIAMNLTRDITFLPAELIDHDKNPPTAPGPGLSVDYGQYLALSCPVCHGLKLSGGEIPGFPSEWPAAGNLTPGPGSRLIMWGEAGFIEIMRQGEKHGRALHPDYMPWTSYRYMNDLELQAVYLYLVSLPASDFGFH
jgi:mono/diheme cytochrome c family protein